MAQPRRGFTLIELMIVVAIIGILAAIAIPKFADLVRKSKEGQTRGNLGAIRSALSIYYGDMEGNYPDTPAALTVSAKYLSAIPSAKVPSYHGDRNTFVFGSGSSDITDTGGWIFGNYAGTDSYGEIYVNCTHTDTKGTAWADY